MPGRRDDWLASYVGNDNKRHSKVLQKKIDAERFIVEMESRKLRGLWTNPEHGKEPFGKWLDEMVEDHNQPAAELAPPGRVLHQEPRAAAIR